MSIEKTNLNRKSDRLVGRSILIGIRYFDANNQLTRQEQLFGIVSRVDYDHGFVIDLDGGDTFTLPPFEWSIASAPSGEYKCVSDGRVYLNPDYLVSWSLIDDAGALDAGPSWKPNYTIINNAERIADWEFTYRPDFERMRKMIEVDGESFVGKHVIVGVTYVRRDGDDEQLIRQEQIHGVIVRVNYSDGIIIQPVVGEELRLPPDLAWLQPASPAEFRLRSTGEVVVNPDYLTTWISASGADDPDMD